MGNVVPDPMVEGVTVEQKDRLAGSLISNEDRRLSLTAEVHGVEV
jgi:hypothetical protein